MHLTRRKRGIKPDGRLLNESRTSSEVPRGRVLADAVTNRILGGYTRETGAKRSS